MKYTTTLLIFLLSFLSYAQESIPALTSVKKTQDSGQIQITEVAKIAVSNTTTVHTYVLNNNSTTTQLDSDNNEQFPTSEEIVSVINTFLAIEGVMECTFDNATQTFTIISEPLTDLSASVKSINKK
jgi:hypothetical protein